MITTRLRALALIAALGALAPIAGTAFADGKSDAPAAAAAAPAAAAGTLIRVDNKTDAAWLAKARADYPLTSCVISGDKFDGGEMGTPLDFVYRQAGKPDRLVRMCCKDCIADFKKDPAKYLKGIDDAAAKAKPAP